MTSKQIDIVRKLARDRNYGRGPRHAIQVNKLSFKVYDELVRLSMVEQTNQERKVLEAVSLLHDVGLPKEPHNEAAFDFLSGEIPERMGAESLHPEELSMILYCILWHCGESFVKRGIVDIVNLTRTKKMAAIIRVADALDRSLQQLVTDVSLRSENRHLIFTISSHCSIETEVNRATEKADLMKEAYGLTEVNFEHAKR